ncbi:MAG: CbiX/SirB N-terminal domain-containing protein [Betaproteobacteria bacterium]|nr:CbiX/SirB N-terminal domain-containing protein [Betaproteobacteria bacterium]
MNAPAVLLLAHGARDPEWARPVQRLAEALERQQSGAWVCTAFLEFMPPSLPEAIDEAVRRGHRRILVVPVFLAAGGHVKRDLPAMITAAANRHSGFRITLADVIGEAESVIAAMAQEVLRQLGERS